jgi:hypothetical protein
MPEYVWNVQLPGEDLPRRITTDYLVSDGDQLTVGGAIWIVERVVTGEDIEDAAGVVWVEAPTEPTPPL